MSFTASVLPVDFFPKEDWGYGVWMDGLDATWYQIETPVFPTNIAILKKILVSLAFFAAIGAAFLIFIPRRVSAMRRQIAKPSGRVFLVGSLGMLVLFGLILVTAKTVIGVAFVPFAILLIPVLGYVLGAFALAMRVFVAFDASDDPCLLIRVLVLAVQSV